MVIGAEEIDDGERLCELIRITAAALPAPKKAAKATKLRGGKRRRPEPTR